MKDLQRRKIYTIMCLRFCRVESCGCLMDDRPWLRLAILTGDYSLPSDI